MALDQGLLLAGRYQIRRLVGEGGMASVYLARDLALGVDLALKVLFPHLRNQSLVSTRFKQEVIAARKIVHPAIIRIFDLVDVQEALFLTMEYFEGVDLKRSLVAGGPMGPDRAVKIASRIAAGLERAHAEGVIHRDVKPHNILIDRDDQVKIVDFGMARVSSLAGMTAQTMVLATPEYAAPELFGAEAADPRADIYSLGVVLYELLSGRLPYRSRAPYELIKLKTETEPIPLANVARGVPEWLERIVARAMARRPEDRFQSATDLLAALSSEGAARGIDRALPARACAGCKREVPIALPYCFECGRETFAVSRHARERHLVAIKSRWVGDRDYLTYDQKYETMQILAEATGRRPRDTRPIDRRLKDPMVTVLDHLPEADARRLQSKLAARGIPTHVMKHRPVLTALESIFLKRETAMLVGVAALTATPTLIYWRMLWEPVFRAFALAPLAGGALMLLGAYWHAARRLRPLVPLGGPRRSLALLAGKGDAALPNAREQAIEWLLDLAKHAAPGARASSARSALAQLFRRALDLELALVEVRWLDGDARRSLRDRLRTALLRAAELAERIEAYDRALDGRAEAEILDQVAKLEAQLERAEPSFDAEPVIEEKSEAEALLAERRELEEARSRTFASLLGIGSTLERLFLRLTETQRAAVDEDTGEALFDLSAELEAIADVDALAPDL